MSAVVVLLVEAELGPQKLCRRCAEWWPADAEFFRRGATCRACERERETEAQRVRRAARRAA